METLSSKGKPETWPCLEWTLFGFGCFNTLDLQDQEETSYSTCKRPRGPFETI